MEFLFTMQLLNTERFPLKCNFCFQFFKNNLSLKYNSNFEYKQIYFYLL